MEGASGVDRTPFQSELGPNTVMTSGFRFSLLNLGSRYAPNERVLITNHLAWSRERGDVENRDNALLNNQAYGEWTWHGDVSVSWLSDKPGKNTLDFGGLFRRLRQDGSTLQFVFTPVQVPSQDVFRGTGSRAGGYVQQSYGFASDRDPPDRGRASGRVQPEPGAGHLAVCQRVVCALEEDARAIGLGTVRAVPGIEPDLLYVHP